MNKFFFEQYDKIVLAYSGGKDSTAILLHLFDLGVNPQKIELHHHLVDGEGENFMDWPCTKAYCEAIAKTFNLPLYFSWREGGFKREMLRNEQHTGAVFFETPDQGLQKVGGSNGKEGTRLKFPQQSSSLSTRWCSSYLKITILATAIANQPRFKGKRTLVLTGERAEESAARAKYAMIESHCTHTKSRHVDHARPILQWTNEQVWEKLKEHRIVAHPSYWLGFGRCSCMSCIFLQDKDWSVLAQITPDRVKEIAQYEEDFGLTIARPRSGEPFPTVLKRSQSVSSREFSQVFARLAMAEQWTMPIILPDNYEWVHPPGAFADLSSGSP